MALGLAILYRRMGDIQAKKLAIPAAYVTIMIGAHLIMPANPEP